MKLSILLLLVVSATALAQTSTPAPAPTILKSENGRFVFGQVSPIHADQFLLDTQTGRLWQMVVDKEGRQKLQPVTYIQVWGFEAYAPDPPEELARFRESVKDNANKEFIKQWEANLESAKANQTPAPQERSKP